MIHVCYGLNDAKGNYSKYTGTSMLSVFENTKEKITVHIFHDNTLSEVNRQKFQAVAEKYNQQIKFYNFDEICPEKIQLLREKIPEFVNSRFTVGAFYRLMIDKKIFDDNISKIIYLDSDTIVNLDIAELWNYNLENYTLAAVPEIDATHGYMVKNKYLLNTGKVEVEDYLCSGVIVLNFDKISENFFYEGINWLANNQSCECPDQDILNYFFSKNYLKLPEKFNAFINPNRRVYGNVVYEKIYHYAGRGNLGMNLKSEHNKLFLQNFVKTGWFDVNIFEGIYKAAKEMYNKNKIFGYKIATAISEKSRAFFTLPPFVASLKNFFNISNREELIVANEKDSLKILSKAIRKSKNKKVFLIMVENYEVVKKQLIQSGFKEFENFVDASIFVPNLETQDFSFQWLEAL